VVQPVIPLVSGLIQSEILAGRNVLGLLWCPSKRTGFWEIRHPRQSESEIDGTDVCAMPPSLPARLEAV
jgi:hypothetical protein